MNILLNGDSNMSGEELRNKEDSIGSQLCKMLNGTETNLALSGASNDYIYDSTIEYLKTNTPDLIVIGWTEMARVQWYLETEGEGAFWEINNLRVGRPVPPEYQGRYDHWCKWMQKTEYYHNTMSFYWHEKIYNLHSILRYKKIPHVFFNAFHSFKIYEPQWQLAWHNSFIGPYDWPSTYVNWCTDQGYKEITPGFHHYEPAGQRAWAERIYNHIIDNKII